MAEARPLQILNLGCGVQSTTLYLMSMRQDEPEHVPAFDYAIFADTQEEPDEVYEHLDWLRSLGGPPILTDTAGKLGDDLIDGFARTRPGKTEVGFKQIPAFQSTREGVLEGKSSRHCTQHYKTGVVEKVIKRTLFGVEPGCMVPDDRRCVQFFGLSFDEPRRIIRVKQRFQDIYWSRPVFPLFDLMMTRKDCVRYLEEVAAGHPVPRSACVFCPFHDNAEWRRIKAGDPKGWARAVEIDRAIRSPGAACAVGLEASLYLHRSCVPLERADLSEDPDPMAAYYDGFAAECEGICGN